MARAGVSGVKEMQRRMRDLSSEFRASVMRAVKNFGETEMAEMKRRTPVDTGELIDSGEVGEPHMVGNHIKLPMAFTADHALVVHEDLEAFHPIGEAKFMESVLNESEKYFGPRVASDVKKDLGM